MSPAMRAPKVAENAHGSGIHVGDYAVHNKFDLLLTGVWQHLPEAPRSATDVT